MNRVLGIYRNRIATLMTLGGLGVAILLLSALPARTDNPPGRPLPALAARLRFLTPTSAADRSYLGLPQKEKRFAITEVKADYLVLEVFSPTCPHCQDVASEVNRIHEKLQRDLPGKRIRFLGVGNGSSAFSLQKFRERYGTPFPSISDPKKIVRDTFGVRRVPHFFVIDLKRRTIIYEEVSPPNMNGIYNAIVSAAR